MQTPFSRSTLNRSSRRYALLILAAAGTMAGCSDSAAKESRDDDVVQALQAMMRNGRGFPGTRPGEEELTRLRRLYETSGYTPLWVSMSGDLRKSGKEAIERLRNADSEGLRPADYFAGSLDSLARRISDQESPDPAGVARLDAGLSHAVLEFLRHIHLGRVTPRSVGYSIDALKEQHDFVALLEAAIRDGSFEEIVRELEPPLTQYRLTRTALGEYRKRETDSLLEQPIRIPVPLKPGDTTASLAALARRLIATGDLAGEAGAPLRYQGALVDAVRRFQARHGLAPDSVLGKETLDELNVPASWRVHQLELSLERLRWLRDLDNAPFLLVNIPMFELTAWTSPSASGPPEFRTGVIVGKALNTETPVFVEEMQYVIFQPYWNIPPSITRNETIPAIERDGDYLRKNGMEIVRGQGDDADPVDPSGGTLEKLARGELRIRQRPGPLNALGPVKFVFPNNQNIYLHGTPAEQLFDRTRRDFSHGCVRVEDPAGLAEWVLAGNPEWTRDRIVEAMNDRSRTSQRVNLPRPLTVVLYYTTASVEADGTVRFARDIYKHDPELDRALHRAGE
jgi:murein L,D-transpeptidase YcbB/YkuD